MYVKEILILLLLLLLLLLFSIVQNVLHIKNITHVWGCFLGIMSLLLTLLKPWAPKFKRHDVKITRDTLCSLTPRWCKVDTHLVFRTCFGEWDVFHIYLGGTNVCLLNIWGGTHPLHPPWYLHLWSKLLHIITHRETHHILHW